MNGTCTEDGSFFCFICLRPLNIRIQVQVNKRTELLGFVRFLCLLHKHRNRSFLEFICMVRLK